MVLRPAVDAIKLNTMKNRPCNSIHQRVGFGGAASITNPLVGFPAGAGRVMMAKMESIDARSATIERAAVPDLSVRHVSTKSDVNNPAEMPEWARDGRPRISVIIPAVNEAAQLHDAIASAGDGYGIELIVVDGGSIDDTTRIAGATGARVIKSARGRAAQMNAGAAAARADILLFLHADARLPPGYAEELERLLATPRAMLVAFRLGIDHSRWAFRLTEFFANVRSRWLGLPYGDQALAIRAVDFFRLGGFREMPIMEDYDFVRRAARLGRIVIARSYVQTSARRWLRAGWLRLTLIHQACILGYRLGVSPHRIAGWRGGGGAGRSSRTLDLASVRSSDAAGTAPCRAVAEAARGGTLE